ncbi:hypothetical protein LXN95_23900, partial [Escherichia coli]|uniref:hypothetical protein n=1 Tax=Escherichia coli TaxID=562 RepID=UPI001E3A516C
KTSIFSHPVYLFLREFSLQDSRGGSFLPGVSEINMKTLSGCANSLCDREVLPAKPEFNGY